MKWALCFIALCCVVHAQTYQPVLVQVINRHGDRTPVEPLTADPAVWNCTQNVIAPGSQEGTTGVISAPTQLYRTLFIEGRQTLLGNCTKGQLTSIGHQQTNSLGTTLRQALISRTNFLSSTYQANEIYVRASDSDRCIQTARNILDGLYPPATNGTALAIPIWLIEENKDNMQISFKNCPAALEQVAKTFIENPSYVIKLLEPLIPHDLQLKKIFNTSFPNLSALKNYDNCNCRVHHNIALPNGMSERIFDSIQQSYWFGGEVVFNSTGAMTVGPFVQELLAFMQQKIDGTLDNKFQLFSGHDTTVGPILAMMDVYNGVWPPYASYIAWTLLQSSTGDYYVQVEYNGVIQKLPGCGNQSPCPWSTFHTLMNPTELPCQVFHRDSQALDYIASRIQSDLPVDTLIHSLLQ